MPPRKRKYVPAAQTDDRESSSSEGEDAGDGHPRRRPAAQQQRRRGSMKDTGVVSTFFGPNHTVSNRSVADLHLATGDEASLHSLIAALPERFPNEKTALRARYEAQFGRWWAQWRSGHSLLFHGFGSKHSLLTKFAKACSTDGACLAVNGLQPGLTPRQILIRTASLAKLTKPGHYRNCSVEDLLDLIKSEAPARRIYVVIHNVDGPGLRDPGGQRMLSEMAALPNVHVAASTDHVNAPLLWDLQTKDRFGWLWHHVPTYVPYVNEVVAAAVPSLLVGRREACTQQSALVVLSSLSHTAREVFRLVADAQLDPAGEGGVTFQRLFGSCRERFLVSNEMLLKAFLTEFRDHELLQTRRGQDGGEVMCVPLAEEALQQVLTEMEGMAN